MRAEDADTAVLDASISLRDHRWPRMSPSTVRYRFNLRAAATSDAADGDGVEHGAGASNGELRLIEHCSLSDARPDDVRHFDVPDHAGAFMPFDTSAADAEKIWRHAAPIAAADHDGVLRRRAEGVSA